MRFARAEKLQWWNTGDETYENLMQVGSDITFFPNGQTTPEKYINTYPACVPFHSDLKVCKFPCQVTTQTSILSPNQYGYHSLENHHGRHSR